MDVFEYLSDHWGLLVLLTGMAIVLGSDVHLEKRMVSCILLTGFMICVYSVTCYIETFIGPFKPDITYLKDRIFAFRIFTLISLRPS